MKFDNIKELFDKENFSAWVNEHKRQVAVGCIERPLFAAGASVISSSKKTENAAEGGSVMTSAVQDTEAAEKTALEEANQLEQDAYPEVNDLVQKYFSRLHVCRRCGWSGVRRGSDQRTVSFFVPRIW